MSRDERLDALEHRLMACKVRVQAGTTYRDRIEIERELRAIGKELAALPPLPTDHLTRHIAAAWSKGVDMAAKKLSAGCTGRTNQQSRPLRRQK